MKGYEGGEGNATGAKKRRKNGGEIVLHAEDEREKII